MKPPAKIVLFMLALSSMAASQLSPNSKHDNPLENECSLTKTVFQLNSDVKISLFKMETLREEINRHLENLKSEEKSTKSTVADLANRIEKQSEEMTVMKDKMANLESNSRGRVQDTGEEIEAKIAGLNRTIQHFSTDLESQLTQVKDGLENDKRNTKTDKVVLLNQTSVGGTYVRWGASTCSGISRLIYSGTLGGGYFFHTGSAVNSLCLPQNPDLKTKLESGSSSGGSFAFMFGGEYGLPGGQYSGIPCAVCDTVSRTKILMLPAKETCPAGWKTEYSGMLLGGYYNHKAATEYNCFDKSLERIPLNEKNTHSKVFYYVAAHCGSLPCGPYVNGELLTCAVCSQ